MRISLRHSGKEAASSLFDVNEGDVITVGRIGIDGTTMTVTARVAHINSVDKNHLNATMSGMHGDPQRLDIYMPLDAYDSMPRCRFFEYPPCVWLVEPDSLGYFEINATSCRGGDIVQRINELIRLIVSLCKSMNSAYVLDFSKDGISFERNHRIMRFAFAPVADGDGFPLIQMAYATSYGEGVDVFDVETAATDIPWRIADLLEPALAARKTTGSRQASRQERRLV